MSIFWRVRRIFLYFSFTLFFWCSMYTKSACVIIHGTWASGERWYRQGGDFFEAVSSAVMEHNFVDETISFSWSGKLGQPSQLEAAAQLVKIINRYEYVILVGHSHGVTVGIIASQLLGLKNSKSPNYYKIKQFYALGVPVDRTRVIYPDMSVVGLFYNLFSFGDYIQPVNLMYDRVFADHPRIANISVQINKEHPSHGGLRSYAIGKDLLKIHTYFGAKKINNFENFSCILPGMIKFFSYGLPYYEVEHNQKDTIELDKIVHDLATKAFFRSLQLDDAGGEKLQ